MVLLIIALMAAAGLWAAAVIEVRGHAVGTYGLLPLLGVPFLAAVALTVGVLVLALWFVRTAWPAVVVSGTAGGRAQRDTEDSRRDSAYKLGLQAFRCRRLSGPRRCSE